MKSATARLILTQPRLRIPAQVAAWATPVRRPTRRSQEHGSPQHHPARCCVAMSSSALPLSHPRSSSIRAPTPVKSASVMASNAASAVAVKYDVVDDDYDQQEVSYDTARRSSTHLIAERSKLRHLERPRLDRLRKQLHQEENGKASVVLSSWSNISRPRNASVANRSNIDHESDKQRPAVPSDLASLRAWLQLMPEPAEDNVLVDAFRRRHNYLRISLTERCNLRCTYCMPPEGVPLQPSTHLLQTNEVLQLCDLFSTLGVTKFRLTGGEPTLRSDIVDVVKGIKALNPKLIGMTSNGIKLVKLLPDLVEAGLDSLNLSLDTLKADKFEKMTRRPAANFHRVMQALEMAHDRYALPSATSSGDRPCFTVKLNCVVMRGVNDDEVADFVRLVHRFPALQVRFIEYMPFDANGWKTSLLVPYRELLDRLGNDRESSSSSLVLDPVPSDDPHDTTKWFSLRGSAVAATDLSANGCRQVGFITSMSSHFCDTCNRLRLTADGQLKSCLFNGGEVSLRDAMRGSGGADNSDQWTTQELHKLIHYGAVLPKKRALGGHDSPQDIHEDAQRNRPMTLIGG